MRLPNRSHPVACTFIQPPGGSGAVILDLQIGGLSSRARAIAGQTTMGEADIIGTTLVFSPRGCGEAIARHPGKGPHKLDADELETLGFALLGIIEAFGATSLSPPDVWEVPRTILQISVEGTLEGLILHQRASVTWAELPFEPIKMAPYSAARLDRSLRRLPLRGKRAWILHMVPMNASDASTGDTFQSLFALDTRTGDVVGHGVAINGSSDAIGGALESIFREAGHRPGTAITTSPRLDDVLGVALKGLGIRYAIGRRMKASDPRVQDLEEFMLWAQPKMIAELMGAPHGAAGEDFV